jgi:pimeloyl-ACP methyl ester carboxylesterase
VLFVHGLAGNGGQWALQLDHLRRWRRALALDLRGHGESDPAEDGAYEVAAFAADVAAVADHFALRRFVLVGHSLGAAAAIAHAAAHPRRVAGLLLVDPNGDQSRIPRAQIEPFLAALRAEPLAELESYYRQLAVGGDRDAARWVIEDLRATHEDAVAAAVEAAMGFAPLPALARFPGPRLAVISGANDLPYSLHKLLPELPVQLVRGTGHWLMMDRPEIFNGILETFLEHVESALD